MTQRFWAAVERDDAEAASALASEPSRGLVEPTLAEVDVQEVLTGEALRNDSSALVATTLVTRREGATLDVTFHTHLVLQEEAWRVDLAASRDELRKGLFVAGMREIGEAVGEGVKEIGEAIREGAREMEDALRKALEDFEVDPDEKRL